MNLFSRLSARQKGLVLVLVPVAFEIVSVAGLTRLLYTNEQQLLKLDQQRAALFNLEKVGSNGAQLIIQVGGMPASADAGPLLHKLENVRMQLTRGASVQLSADEIPVGGKEAVLQAQVLKGEILRLVARTELFFKNPKRNEDERFNFLRNQAFATGMAFENFSESIIALERSAKESEPAQIARMRADLLLVLASIIAASSALTLALVYFFSADIVKRLKAIEYNAQMLATGGTLLPRQGGSDEIADLDLVLHETGDTLALTRKQQLVLLDNAVEIICSLDEKLKITAVNAAVEKLWNYQPEDVLGKSLLSLLPPEAVSKTRADFKAVRREAAAALSEPEKSGRQSRPAMSDPEKSGRQSRPVTLEAEMLCGGGKRGIFRWSLSWSAARKTYTCVVHDITVAKKAERLKNSFIAMVSHDLRAPLSSLGVGLAMLKTGKRGEIPGAVSKQLDAVEANLARLSEVVNGLLELDKMEAGRGSLQTEAVHTYNILASIKESCKRRASRPGVGITGPVDDCFISADQNKLATALGSILEFSIRRAPAGTSVNIEIIKSGAEVELRFTDQGEAIAPGELELLFERFTAASGTGGEQVGLALTVARAIIKAHQGRIEVVSTEGSPTSICVFLPAAAVQDDTGDADIDEFCEDSEAPEDHEGPEDHEEAEDHEASGGSEAPGEVENETTS